MALDQRARLGQCPWLQYVYAVILALHNLVWTANLEMNYVPVRLQHAADVEDIQRNSLTQPLANKNLSEHCFLSLDILD